MQMNWAKTKKNGSAPLLEAQQKDDWWSNLKNDTQVWKGIDSDTLLYLGSPAAYV